MSIKLAVNGVPELYALLGTHPDLPIHAIKAPLSPISTPEVERAHQHRPVLLHGWGPPGYSVTDDTVPEEALLARLVTLSGTPTLSVHLDPRHDDGHDEAALLGRIARQADRLRALSGLPLLLENVPWRPGTGRPRWGTDPDFIRAALDAARADLLLDLAHARVAAHHRRTDPRAYLAVLPLHRVRELHVSGPRTGPDGLRDRHLTLQTEDWALLDWTLPRTPHAAWLTHEYMGLHAPAHPQGPAGPAALARDLHLLGRRAEAAPTT